MSGMPLRVLIVDDEPLARSGLSDYVSRVEFLTEVGQARDGMEALTKLEQVEVDLLLLDIQMEGLSGVELMQSLSHPPAVIFTTAHPGFAVEGFELNAVDYLLKPITFPRFLKGALKAKHLLRGDSGVDNSSATDQEEKSGTVSPVSVPPPQEPIRKGSGNEPVHAEPKDLFIKEDGRVERIQVRSINYLESMQNYCRIHTSQGSYLPLLPLKEITEALPEGEFFRIHRSYVVRLAAVEAIDGNQVRIAGKHLPVSRPNRSELERRLVGDRLI